MSKPLHWTSIAAVCSQTSPPTTAFPPPHTHQMYSCLLSEKYLINDRVSSHRRANPSPPTSIAVPVCRVAPCCVRNRAQTCQLISVVLNSGETEEETIQEERERRVGRRWGRRINEHKASVIVG